MIDIHCHLIPGIDDGARDEADALSLLRLAQNDGITHMVMTPHIHLGRFDNSKQGIFNAFFELKEKARLNHIKLDLACAAEVRIDAELMQLIEQNQLPFLGRDIITKTRFLLLELPHSHIPAGIDKLIKWFQSVNITPVIPHPERNRDIQKQPDFVAQLKRLNCKIQLTAGSITGEFGSKAQDCAHYFIEKGWCDYVASDAHNASRRPPILSKAFTEVEKVYSLELAKQLFIENPRALTQSLFI